MEVSGFLCSRYEKTSAIRLARGSAIINPDNSGFFPDSQLANAMTMAANKILNKKNIFFYKHTLYKKFIKYSFIKLFCNDMKNILITGASGYIGSCLFHYLQGDKYNVYGLDKKITNNKKIIICNLTNTSKLEKIIKIIKPEIIIHLAAQSLVDETINKKKYYLNNVEATKSLLSVMNKYSIKNIIFSSTAAVYNYKNTKLNETDPVNPKSNYAKTKLNCEKKIINNKKINSIIFRFFNVCSALTKPKLIGELHNPETHLIPTVTYKAKLKKKIYIYGDDFETRDGSCVRDYVHIEDICIAIKSALDFLIKHKKSQIFNIGSSDGFSNFEILNAVKKSVNQILNYQIVGRRAGDAASLVCNSSKARKLLKCKFAKSNLKTIINDEFKWIEFLRTQKKKRYFKNYL